MTIKCSLTKKLKVFRKKNGTCKLLVGYLFKHRTCLHIKESYLHTKFLHTTEHCFQQNASAKRCVNVDEAKGVC